MDEVPYRTVVDLQASLGELGHKPAQREVAVLDPLQQPERWSPEIAFGL